jgi:hypothetical protein
MGWTGAEQRGAKSRNESWDPKLLAALVIPMLGALSASPYQDFLPGYVASVLLRQGHAADIYLPAGAPSLFDGSPAFVREALAVGAPVYARRETVTAFVAPPPSLLAYAPFAHLPYPWAAHLWVALQGLLMSLSLWVLDRRAREAGISWRPALVAFTPAALLVGVSGQSSGFLLAAAAAFFLPRSRSADVLLAASLATSIVFKLWPAPALVALALLGRWRAATYCALMVALWVALAVLVLPPALYFAFAASASWVATRVVSVPRNLSIANALAKLILRANTTDFVAPSGSLTLLEGAARMGLVLAFGGAFFRGRLHPELGWAAVWCLLLACSPLLWDHYLIVAPALLLPAAAAAPASHGRWARVSLAATGIFCLAAMANLPQRAPWVGFAVAANLTLHVLTACWRGLPRWMPSQGRA